jgi:3-hydroxybutyryl-CoA dehydrogenase
MGSGIAQVFASHGFSTILFDVNEAVLAKARAKIEKYAAGAVSRLTFTTDINICRASFIIEAIVENEQLKTGLFTKLIEVNPTDTIFASNTSSLSITSLAKKINLEETFVGMHFFNPAPLMNLVEVVRTTHSSPRTINFVMSLARETGKTPVLCSDSPGFIVNRVARPYYLESLQLLEKYSVPIETIDKLLEATGFKMGPFRLMDLIGNDINHAVSCLVYDALGNPARLQPSPLQEKQVRDGLLGRKTGKGYYEYPAS